VTVSWFGHQNQTGHGLSVVPQNRQVDEGGVEHTSKSSDLLHVETTRVRVSQSSFKTGVGVTTGDAHDIIVKVASRSS
jgi:hypothetical protein